jgi:hypothetical protein
VTLYNHVHYVLVQTRGLARNHLCRCGKRASDWAYQHNGDPEVYDEESGRPFSEDLDHYEPMCRSCHFKLDATDTHVRTGQAVGRGNVLRAQQDPAFAAKVSVDRANAARAANRIKRRCLDCLLTAHPAALGAHLKRTGHSGYEQLEST